MKTIDGVKRFYVLGIAGFLLIEFLARNVLLPQSLDDLSIWISLLIEWGLFLTLIFFWLPRLEQDRLAAIGVKSFLWRHLVVGAAAYVIAFVPIALASYALDSLGLPTLRSLQSTLNSYQPITLVGLFLTGTILEEFLYRGYLIERLTLLYGSPWLAGFVSWLLFTFVHLKFMGLVPLVEIGILAAVLTLVYLRERSVWPCVVCHGLNNAMAYLIFPMLVS
jgi:membrane protease YdiL (CAAX protease family)